MMVGVVILMVVIVMVGVVIGIATYTASRITRRFEGRGGHRRASTSVQTSVIFDFLENRFFRRLGRFHLAERLENEIIQRGL